MASCATKPDNVFAGQNDAARGGLRLVILPFSRRRQDDADERKRRAPRYMGSSCPTGDSGPWTDLYRWPLQLNSTGETLFSPCAISSCCAPAHGAACVQTHLQGPKSFEVWLRTLPPSGAPSFCAGRRAQRLPAIDAGDQQAR